MSSLKQSGGLIRSFFRPDMGLCSRLTVSLNAEMLPVIATCFFFVLFSHRQQMNNTAALQLRGEERGLRHICGFTYQATIVKKAPARSESYENITSDEEKDTHKCCCCLNNSKKKSENRGLPSFLQSN
ncbi:hypothetical protein FQA47_025336 [Oryzias melastigma]|uniref:Uncharacterized protein n=1 Tax=Oryzias melastigma TaxID=30732 RepID=A0A834L252_ORYME|nr:hypothetical protein FQA47_025336 [Oryzias melastigma]